MRTPFMTRHSSMHFSIFPPAAKARSQLGVMDPSNGVLGTSTDVQILSRGQLSSPRSAGRKSFKTLRCTDQTSTRTLTSRECFRVSTLVRKSTPATNALRPPLSSSLLVCVYAAHKPVSGNAPRERDVETGEDTSRYPKSREPERTRRVKRDGRKDRRRGACDEASKTTTDLSV